MHWARQGWWRPSARWWCAKDPGDRGGFGGGGLRASAVEYPALLETIRDVMEELADLADISPTVLRPMLQTVGLALVTKLAASLCRDAGEGGVASFVEVAGAAAAVLVSLPLLKMVLQLVMGLL
ncbi:MAG: SpoIIIAC/SpoIIIAD family protein [Evtepia gabavorous]